MTPKNVLITGASRGIGKACAIQFARAGYHVFINCRQSVNELLQVQEQITAHGGSCDTVVGNVSEPEQVRGIFEKIQTKCPGLDALVNNAGISYIGLLSEMGDDDWANVLNTNLSSAFYCSKAAIPYMIRQKQGKIINISSMWGRTGASCEAAYSAAKAGLNGLTIALAKELAPSNIQVNAIACGIIDTAMNSGFSEAERITMTNEIPACRFGTPEEVALLAYDLAEHHPYMTGQIIGLDGGYI